ncbi:uncharacterized protein LOC110450989 [Mizuhopecten yessoensis]|uniref:uncharacterized protein LOC110450989 n=1 Tax=Mizuhopecten yessoensis TaxID=6573 RepID=UPI000B45C782|nr:uncharacterized protein LOC110450989 [Mizuhopecten yessoensis]
MPGNLKCLCRICRGDGPPVSRYLRLSHKRKYGDFASYNAYEYDDQSVLNYAEKERPESDNDKLQDDDDSREQDNNYNESTQQEFEHPNGEQNNAERTLHLDHIDTDAEMDTAFEISSESDQSSNSGDSLEENGDSCTNNLNDIVKKGIWNFNYDKTLYSSGLAIEEIPGTDLTILQWIALNFHTFTSHPSFSKEAFTDTLKIQKRLLTSTSNGRNIPLPSSYYEAKKLIRDFLVKKVSFHVCPKDCVIFRNSEKYSYADLQKCPVCGEERYKNHEKKTPHRTFDYIPIGPRLARIYGEPNLATIVQSHPGSTNELLEKHNQMFDIHDAPKWKSVYSENGFFKSDKMGLSFAMEVDGVNPYHNIGVIYSMTPIMLTILNLPRHIRNRFESIMLVGIIKGQRNHSEASVDAYVEVLVDELLFLSGCTTFTAYNKAPVQVKLKLLLHVLDYPGLSKLFHQHGSGSLSACHWCNIQGIHCPKLQKVVYLQNRSYLKDNDMIRQDYSNFIGKCVDDSSKPKARILETEKTYREAYENAKNKTQAKTVAKVTGCKGKYPLLNLPGHNRIEECCPDACHTLKDVVQTIVHLISCKNVNKEKKIAAEKHYGRFNDFRQDPPNASCDKDLEVPEKSSRKRKWHSVSKSKPKASSRQVLTQDSSVADCEHPAVQYPFFLTRNELKKADERANLLKFPIDFGLKSADYFSKSSSLKSHDWKQLGTQGILKFCIRGLLGNLQRRTLFMLLDCFSDICCEHQSLDELDELEGRFNTALARLERDFPITLQNITTHILHHIIDGIRSFGPVYGTWMYVFERFNSWLCKRSLNMCHPEATATETYILYDWCQFMIQSGKLDINTASLPGISEDVQDDVYKEGRIGNSGRRERIALGLRYLDVIHGQCGTRTAECNISNGCKVDKITDTVLVEQPFLKKRITYSCRSAEKCTKTVSSFVCVESKRGSQNQKLVDGKFAAFGRIQYFLEHKGGSNKRDLLACVSLFENTEYDVENGLWFARSEEIRKSRYVHTDSLSAPLITGTDNGCLWFCNYRKARSKQI